MLLVSPTMQGNVPSFAALKIHAGGLAWIGDRLYVPVTTGGFRVFDLGTASAQAILLLIITILLSRLYIRVLYKEVN